MGTWAVSRQHGVVPYRAKVAARSPIGSASTHPGATARTPSPLGAGRPRGNRLREPGWPRALLGAGIGGALGFGLVVALRTISDLEIFQTEQTGYPHLIVPAMTAPIGFLAGIGCFDYWFRWAMESPPCPKITPTTVPIRGATTSASTPITR